MAPVLEELKLVNTSQELACKPGHATPAPQPEPEPVIAFAGGASYTPVVVPDAPPARDWHSSLPPKEFYTEFIAPRERREQQADQAHATPQAAPPPAEQPTQHAMEILLAGRGRVPLLAHPPGVPQPKPKRRRRRASSDELGQPDDPHILADKHGRLLGKAQKVAQSNPRQAAALRRQATEIKRQLDTMPLPIEAAIEARPALDSQAKEEARPRSLAFSAQPLKLEPSYIDGVRIMALHGDRAVQDYLYAKHIPPSQHAAYITAAKGETWHARAH